jgi:hypothetical protein
MAMRKLVWMPLALLALGAAGFFGFAPGYLEASMNKIDGQPLIPVSAEAKALHQTLQIVDLHSDTDVGPQSAATGEARPRGPATAASGQCRIAVVLQRDQDPARAEL